MKSFMDTDPIYSSDSRIYPENSNTGDPNSYAFTTTRKRWPQIWSSAIEVKATIGGQNLSPQDEAAGHEIILKLEHLKSALANDAALEPIPADGGSDVDGYNDELRSLGRLTWLAAP